MTLYTTVDFVILASILHLVSSLQPISVTIDAEPVFWEDMTYRIGFSVDVIHQGDKGDMFSLKDPNFNVTLSLVGDGVDALITDITLDNPSLLMQAFDEGETIKITGMGAVVILASDCQNFKSQLSIRVLVTPSETLQTMDYIEQEIVRDISQQVSVKCSDVWLDIIAQNLMLEDEDGNEIHKIELGSPTATSFEIQVVITIGPGGSPESFISSSGNNYIYELYLSRTQHTTAYKLDYTPSHDEFDNAVNGDTVHTLTGSDLTLPDNQHTRQLCGAVYLIVVVLDTRNTRRRRRDVLPVEKDLLHDIIAPVHSADPNLTNNYFSKQIVLNCPGDLFELSDVSLQNQPVILMDNAFLEFSARVTNSHYQGYSIPKSSTGKPNFTFKLLVSRQEVGLSDILCSAEDKDKLTGALLAGKSLHLSLVRLVLNVDSALCMDINNDNWSLVVVPDVGLPAGFVDLYSDNDVFNLTGLDCNNDVYNFAADNVSLSVSTVGVQTTLTINFDVQINPGSKVNEVPNPALEVFIDGVSYGNPSVTPSSSSDNIATWMASKVFEPVYCGVLVVKLLIDPNNTVMETSEEDNIIEKTVTSSCTEDLYGTHFEVQTEEIFFPGVATTFGFDAKIYNLESSAIREAATTDPDNFIIKLFAGNGTVLNRLSALDVTPEWRYNTHSTNTDPLSYYKQEHAAGEAIVFSDVHSHLSLPPEVCTLGYDHLFLTVEVLGATLTTGVYEESVFDDNYIALPFQCAQEEDGVDLSIITLRNGKKLFRLEGRNSLILGEEVPFSLEISALSTRSIDTPPSNTWFDYGLYLVDDDGDEIEIPHNIKDDTSTHLVTQEGRLRIGGLIFLDPKMFLSFCVHGASLRVRLDPDNLINETDELNNAADISGMNITGGSQNYCNAVDLLPTHIYIDPPSKHNVIYSQQDTDFHFSFEVIKGTANNPTQFKYLAMISLDGDIDNPTNRNLTIQSHNLAHGNDVTFTEKISVFVAEDPLNSLNHLFCGHSPYIGVWINHDMAVSELRTDNNIIWRQYRLMCDHIDGLSISHIVLTSTDHNTKIKAEQNTVSVELGILNKGTELSDSLIPGEGIFKLNMYTNNANSLTGAKLLSVNWINDDERDQGMLKWTVRMLTDIQAQFTLPSHICTSMTHLCVEVEADTGMAPTFVDNYHEDNILCYDLVHGNITLDCGRDISVSRVTLTPISVKKFYKDIPTAAIVDLILGVEGQPLHTSVDEPYLGIQVFLSNQNQPQPTESFNSGTPVTLVDASDVVWDKFSAKVLTSPVSSGSEYELSAKVDLTLTQIHCNSLDGPRYLCVEWLPLHHFISTVHDPDINNNYHCTEVTPLIDCSQDTLDLMPVKLDLGEAVAMVELSHDFNLDIQVQIGSEAVEGPVKFNAALYLSTDRQLDPFDYKIEYKAFQYGKAASEMKRPLGSGVNHINIGGSGFYLEPSIPSVDMSLCGDIYFIAVVDTDGEVEETNEDNNVISAELTLVCPEDAVLLSDVVLDMPDSRIYAEEDTVLILSLTVQNMRNTLIPTPSTGSALFNIEVYAVSFSSGAEDAILISGSEVIFPTAYYRQMLPPEKVRLSPVDIPILGQAFTLEVCTQSSHLKVILVPSRDVTDNIPNHEITIPLPVTMKSCTPASENIQLYLSHFQTPDMVVLPAQVSVSLTAVSRLWVDSSSGSLQPHSFITSLYVSRDSELNLHSDYLWRHIANEQAVPVGISTLESSRNLALQNENEDLQYCGHTYIMAVLDSDYDLMEPSRHDHILTAETVFICPNDVFGISDVQFQTHDQQLVANEQMKFTLKVQVICTKIDCNFENAMENVQFYLEAQNTSTAAASVLAVINNQWGDEPGQGVEPGLGSSYLYTGHTRDFTIYGFIWVRNACSYTNDTLLTLRLALGSDLNEKVEDQVPENDKYTFPYRCVTAKGRDLRLLDFVFFSNPNIYPVTSNPFFLTMKLTGEAILPIDVAPTLSPFSLAFWLSEDDIRSEDDARLAYQVSECMSKVLLSQGFTEGESMDVQDYTGLFMPAGFCGVWYIIAQLDNKDEILELSEDNNYMTMKVNIICKEDVLQVNRPGLPRYLEIWRDSPVSVSLDLIIKNIGSHDLPACTPPCEQRSVVAVLSEDTQYNPLYDERIKITLRPGYQLKLATPLPMEHTLTLKGVTVDLILDSSMCTGYNFLLIGVMLSGEQTVTEDYLQNNFVIIPLNKYCDLESLVDLQYVNTSNATGFLYEAEKTFLGSLVWQGETLLPPGMQIDPYMTQIWLSADRTLDKDRDVAISHEYTEVFKDLITTSGAKSFYSILKSNSYSQIAKLCGQAYAIVEIDPANVVNDRNKKNNIGVTAMHVSCVAGANNLTLLTDMFGLTEVSVSVESDVLPWPDELYTFSANITVICYTDCPSAATYVQLAFPVHYTLKFKVYDSDFLEVTSLNPGEIDADWVSMAVSDGDNQTNFFPETSFQTDFTTQDTIDISLSGHFSVSPGRQCSLVHYLGVSIEKGDSDQVKDADWGIIENDVRYVPLMLQCLEEAVDLQIDVFQVSENSASVTLDLTSLDRVSLDLVVSSATGFWPKYVPDKPLFDYKFYISDTVSEKTEHSIDLRYSLPETLRPVLHVSPPKGATLNLSDTEVMFNKQLLERICGREPLYIAVEIDTFNDVMEVREDNNIAAIPLSVTGCKDNFDVVLRRVNFINMEEYLYNTLYAAGDTEIFFDLDVTFSLTNVLGSSSLDAANLDLFKVEMLIYKDKDHMITELKPKLTSQNSTSNVISPVHAVAQVLHVTYRGTVHVPGYSDFCHHTWLVKTTVDWEDLQDSDMRSNTMWLPLYISCPDDQLALYSVKLGVDLQSHDFELWPLLPISVPLRVTVKNHGVYLGNSTAELFYVRVYYSVNDILDPTEDHMTTAQYNNGDFVQRGSIATDELVQTQWITGVIEIHRLADCISSLHTNFSPTLFIVLDTVDPAFSVYGGNDIIKLPLRKESIHCVPDQVDLLVSEFTVATFPLHANVDTGFTLRLGIRKTETGTIGQSNPTDPQDVSIQVSLYLSVDETLSADDAKIPVTFTTSQMDRLRLGVPQTSLPEYVLDGDQLKIDLQNEPGLSVYCGKSYILVEVTDTKNQPNIDPNLSNNLMVYNLELICDHDTLALSHFAIAPRDKQEFFYTGVDIETDFSVTIWNFIERIEQATEQRPNYYLKLFISPDKNLDVEQDTEVDIVKVPDIWYEYSMKQIGPDPLELIGPVVINIPSSACTSHYLIIVLYKGVSVTQKDNIILNNLRYIDISDLLRCSENTVDVSVKMFALSKDSHLNAGEAISFTLTSAITIFGNGMVGNGVNPIFSFQFYLSEDECFDKTDTSFDFKGTEQKIILSQMFTKSIDLTLDSVSEDLKVPLLEEQYCGLSFVLVVVDVENQVLEISEYNNVMVVPVTISCPRDVLDVKYHRVHLPDVLYLNWASVSLSLSVTNVGISPTESEIDYNIIDFKVTIQRSSDWVEHDIMPSGWRFSQGNLKKMSGNLANMGELTLIDMVGDIDISRACSASYQGLETGNATFKVEAVLKHGVNGSTECVTTNNVYKQIVTVNCESEVDSIDLKFINFTLDDEILQEGINNIYVRGETRTTGSSLGSGFQYAFHLGAEEMHQYIGTKLPIDNSLGGEFLITQLPYLTTDLGLTFLCTYPGSVVLTALLDTANQVTETCELNNQISIQDLTLSSHLCQEGVDLWAVNFEVTNLDMAVARTYKMPLTFNSRVAVTNLGPEPLPLLSGDQTHFSFSFVLSSDVHYDPDTDVTFTPESLEPQQVIQLQKEISVGNTTLLTLTGSNLVIPLTKDTHPFCWTHPYVGILLDHDNSLDETSENNNAVFYRIVLDCGDALDECSEELHSCSEFGKCSDLWYNLTSFTGQPYLCECSPGFQGDGMTCTDVDECSSGNQCSDTTLTECYNYIGGYDCRCITGYKADVDGDCININECSNSGVHACHENASCSDTVGSYTCKCLDGFVGDGMFNCTDKAECTADSCSNGGTCRDGIQGFTCLCPQGYSGDTCEAVDSHWSEWSDWSGCTAQCGPGFRSRNRSCIYPDTTSSARPCSRELDSEKQNKTCYVRACEEGHIPWCDYNPCFKMSGGLCLYQEKGRSYSCECSIGYTKLRAKNSKFRRCEDIDECTTKDSNKQIHDCDNHASCENVHSSFSCSCNQGYHGDGRVCSDVNECESSDVCPDFADCNNTPGSFVCSCQEGYQKIDGGERGFTCIEQRLLPYGETAGDTELVLGQLQSSVTKERVSTLISIPQGLPLFDGQLVNSLYISENGLVVLTDETIDRPNKETYNYPTPLTSEVFEGSNQYTQGFLAPFWADCHSNSIFHKVWYQTYTDRNEDIFDRVNTLLNAGLRKSVNPLFILKVTWHNMAPTYMSDTSERNTFQLVLATDYIHSYVFYVYKNQGMNWKPLAYNTTNLQLMYKGYPARIGYAIRGANDTIHSEESEHSAKWSTDNSKPNAYRVSDKNMQSHNKKGWLFYQLDNNPDSFTNPMMACQSWYEAEGDISSWSSDILHTCPPDALYAGRDQRVTWINRTSTQPYNCFTRTLPNAHDASFSCCYDNDGMLINSLSTSDNDNLGFLMKSVNHSDHQRVDISPYLWCCVEAKKTKFSDLYLKKRPLVTAVNYEHLSTAWIYGSVHMETLDGARLDLLGFGEYVWLQAESADVMVQLRTAISSQQALSPPTAVVLSAVAAKVGLSPSLQVYVNKSGEMDVWVDDAMYTGQPVTHAAVKQNENQVTLVFEVGISLVITSSNQQLSVLIQVPGNMKDLQGLIGNMDGMENNDFTTSAGETLNLENSKPSEIHSYTETWALRNLFGPTNADSNSLFFHYDTPTSANSYFITGFSPVFYTEADYTEEERQACTLTDELDLSCLYDVRVTGNIEEPQQGVHRARTWTELKQFLRNQPPVFDRTVPKFIEARVGIPEFIQLKATDPEGDSMTLKVHIVDLDTGVRKSMELITTVANGNVISGSYKWQPEKRKVHLIFEAIDTVGSRSTLTPKITLCACDNQAICDHDIYTEISGNFHFGLCRCHGGHTGQFCEEDFDGCLVKHCFGECIDRMPDEVRADLDEIEFLCEACPDGMEGTGSECYDLNECVLPSSDSRKHNCTQTCENKVSGFRCTCLEGYMLSSDQRTCVDIPECRSANCDPVHGTCNDTQGSFICGCQAGFELSEDGVTCEDVDECLDVGRNCFRLCVNTPGSYHCECGYGYTQDPSNSSNCLTLDMCKSDVYCHDRCINQTAHYECGCSLDYELHSNGWECLPYIPCEVNHCDPDHGICTMIAGEAVCSCANGYQLSGLDGRTCSDINECATGTHQCGRYSACVNNAGSYHCVCARGYRASSYNDKQCVDIDECVEFSECSHSCSNTQGTFSCACYSGYYLLADSRTCVDIDECAPGGENDCDEYANCTNYRGYYTCTCKSGYTGIGSDCYDLNECDHDNGGCGGDCHNVEGSFSCTCAVGFMLDEDGFSCVDVNECLNPHIHCSQGCENTDGSYYCTCKENFKLLPDGVNCLPDVQCSQSQSCGQGGVCSEISGEPQCECNLGYRINQISGFCEDVDECTTRTTDNTDKRSIDNTTDFMEDCASPLGTCVNTNGGYMCTCPPGYKLHADGLSCLDVDECITPDTETANRCDLTSTICINQIGDYRCECLSGFKYSSPNVCVDIDECDLLEMGYSVCHDRATCKNYPGYFTCSCDVGYIGDGHVCSDLDECSSPSHNTSCQLNQTCVNSVGSFYCVCEEGYKFDGNMEKCLDINECFSPVLNPCKFSCENLIGSFRCTCPKGYYLDPSGGQTCRVSEECVSQNMKSPCEHECVRYDNMDKCVCYSGYTRVQNECRDLDECTNRNPAYGRDCGVHSECVNHVGNFTCQCDQYYLPDVDGLACTETDGEWSMWTLWTNCSKTCNGRRIRTRNCDSPQPTINRMCPGVDTQYTLCNADGRSCFAQPQEIEISVVVHFPYLSTELWESVEDSFYEALCKGFNSYCWTDALNYEKCCNIPLEDQVLLSHYKEFCSVNDIVMVNGYPSGLTTTSIMIYMEMLESSDLCGEIGPVPSKTSTDISSRSKRDLNTYIVPRELLQEVLSSSQTRTYVYLAVKRDTALADHMLNYSTELPQFEESTVPPEADDGVSLLAIILAVVFSIAGVVACVLVIYCLIRMTKRPEDDVIKAGEPPSVLPDFNEKPSDEDSEDEIIRKVFENSSVSADDSDDDPSFCDTDSEASELQVIKQYSTLSTDYINLEDETALHPHRTMTTSPSVSIKNQQGSAVDGCLSQMPPRGPSVLEGRDTSSTEGRWEEHMEELKNLSNQSSSSARGKGRQQFHQEMEERSTSTESGASSTKDTQM